MPGTVGYAIKPHAARALVKEYRSYFLPSDNSINSHLCNIQIHNYQIGRTTLKEEGNISTVRTKENK
jgi:GR25 family glycosyltransferase involved in LPS biosynthesis